MGKKRVKKRTHVEEEVSVSGGGRCGEPSDARCASGGMPFRTRGFLFSGSSPGVGVC
jgi:hypothetical protein